MIVYALWYGGSSYAAPDQFVRRDVERFGSLREARKTFAARADRDPHYPCVNTCTPTDGGPEMWIYFSDPFEIGDAYPDRVLAFGPRGGIVSQ